MALTSFETTGPAAVTIPGGTMTAQASSAFDDGFRQRLALIVNLMHVAVYYEDPATTNHAARLNYLKLVSTNPLAYVINSIGWTVLADGVTDSGSTDQAIANRLGDVLDTLSHGY